MGPPCLCPPSFCFPFPSMPKEEPQPRQSCSQTPIRLLHNPRSQTLESNHLPEQLRKNGLETTKELQIRIRAKELPILGRHLNKKRWKRGRSCTSRGISTGLVNTVEYPTLISQAPNSLPILREGKFTETKVIHE